MFDHGNLRITPPNANFLNDGGEYFLNKAFFSLGGSAARWGGARPFRLPYFGATKSSRRRNRSDVFNVSVFMEEVVPKSDRSVLVSGSQRLERNQRLQVELNFHTKFLFVWMENSCFSFLTFRVQEKRQTKEV